MQAIEMSHRRGEVRWEWIGDAWKMFTQSPGTWIGMLLISIIVGAVGIGLPMGIFIFPAIAAAGVGGREPSAAGIAAVAGTAFIAFLVILVIGMLVGSFLLTGFYKTAIKQVRGESISVGDLFSGADSFLRVLGLTLLLAVAGIAILVAFGILSSLVDEMIVLGQLVQSALSLAAQGFLFYSIPLIVDKKMGVVEAIQTSIQATKSNWWMYLLFLVVMTILMTVSMIPCGLGLLVTVPMYFLAPAIAYRDTFLSSEPLGGFGGYSPAPPPPNYYAPPQPQFSAPPQQFMPPPPPQQQYSPPVAPPQPYSPPPEPMSPPVMATQQYTPPTPPAPAPNLHSQDTQIIGKNCPNCGAALTRVSNFCNQCGSPINLS